MQNPTSKRVRFRFLILSTLLLSLSFPAFAQTWTRMFAMDGDWENSSILSTRDGGYLVSAPQTTYYAADLIRLNVDGDSLWTATDTTNSWLGGYASRPDGSFLCAAFHHYTFAIFQIDSAGTTRAIIHYDSLANPFVPQNIEATSDQGFIIPCDVLLTNTVGGTSLVKIHSDLSLQWYQTPIEGLHIYSVKEHPDHGFFGVGTLARYLMSSLQSVMKTDSLGSINWIRYYGVGSLSSLDVLPDGGFVVCGVDSLQNRIVKRMNSSGDTIWTRTYTGGNFHRVRFCADSTIVLSGDAPQWPTTAMLLLKLSLQNEVLWERTYSNGAMTFPSGSDYRQTQDGGYVICGGWGANPSTAFIVKTDADGVVSVNEHQANQLPETSKLLQNYPNPFNPTTSIRYSLASPGMVDMNVFDVTGREVATLARERQSAGLYSVKFDASKLPSGIYFYRLQTNRFTAMKKMILVK